MSLGKNPALTLRKVGKYGIQVRALSGVRGSQEVPHVHARAAPEADTTGIREGLREVRWGGATYFRAQGEICSVAFPHVASVL